MSDQQYEPSTPVKQRNPIFPPGWYERYGLTPPSLKNFSAILGEAIQEDADADEQAPYTTEGESTQHDADKSSFEEWYNKLASDAASELPMERSGSPELDISVADSELAASTSAHTGESIPELAEAGDITPSRPISVLLQTPWFDMTEHEKARVLLPMVHGQHPADVEAEGVAINPAAAFAGPSSIPSRGVLHQEAVDDDEEDRDEELEAQLVRGKARKAREDAKLKKDAKRAKHAAYMRRRRAEEKRLKEEAEQKAMKARKERMEMRKQAGIQQTMAELIAAEQVRIAQEQQQQMADQNSFGGLSFGSAFSSGA